MANATITTRPEDTRIVLRGSFRIREDSAAYLEWSHNCTPDEVVHFLHELQWRPADRLTLIGQTITGHQRGSTYQGHVHVSAVRINGVTLDQED